MSDKDTPEAPIYEVVDRTCGEVYFTIGLFPSLADALAAIEGDEPPQGDGSEFEDYADIGIFERRFGFCGCGDLTECLTSNQNLS
jgi:hypothetical protein